MGEKSFFTLLYVLYFTLFLLPLHIQVTVLENVQAKIYLGEIS